MKRHWIPSALLLPARVPPRALLLPALLLTGCGHSDPTRFWTLDPAPPTQAPGVAAMTPVRVLTVRVPLAIDRLELTQQISANRVAVRDFDRWSAPLGELMRIALTQDLRARLPADTVLAAAEPRPGTARDLVVDVLDLQPTSDGYLLEASWSLLRAAKGAPITRHDVRLLTPAGAGDAQAQARAISRLVGALADNIGAALASAR